MIIFVPVIEDGKEAVREVEYGEWFETWDKQIRKWIISHTSTNDEYPIYRRVDLDVDPIKESRDRDDNNAWSDIEAIDNYIKKVYGNEFSKVV